MDITRSNPSGPGSRVDSPEQPGMIIPQLPQLRPPHQIAPPQQQLQNSHQHSGPQDLGEPPLIQSRPESLRCHLCARVYQRADHLHIHLKNHENLRPHQCPQCSMRFNRADLLRRHRNSHDRLSTAKALSELPRTRERRRDRVIAACLACVTSRSKCQDEKPCARCKRRQIECEPVSNTAQIPQQASRSANIANNDHADDSRHDHLISPPQYVSDQVSQLNSSASNISNYIMPCADPTLGSVQQANSRHRETDYYDDTRVADHIDQGFDPFKGLHGSYMDEYYQVNQGLTFMPRDAYTDFGVWDIDLEGIELAYQDWELDQTQQRPAQPTGIGEVNVSQEVSRRSAAFGRSTWIWNPTHNDQTTNEQSNVQLNEESIPSILTPASTNIAADKFASCFTTAARRDQILGILYTTRRTPTQIPSLPSLALLNKIIQVYFVFASHWPEHMVHAASFDGSKALLQLTLAIIAAGSTLIPVQSLWKVGLALQEVVRHTVGEFWEQDNSNTRNLQSLQAFIIGLDIGLWSGYKRKMEIAESFGQPAVAILRRAGIFAAPRLASSTYPLSSDSEAIAESKWKKWIEWESFKRLALHAFTHDVFASVGLQKPPLILFTELKFELPSSEKLWLAKSALEWRENFLAADISEIKIPSFMEAMQNPGSLIHYSRQINVHLSALIILHGFWGQIHGLLDARKYHARGSSTHQLSMMSSGNELYRDLSRFAARLPDLTGNSADVILLSELFLMIFHANLEDLQRFAGRFGEAEAAEANEEFRIWAKTTEARTAVWHAAQVIKAARRLPPNALMAFNAIAVYYATITLWIYGLMAPHSSSWNASPDRQFQSTTLLEVALNEEDGTECLAFRENDLGVPGLVVFGSEGRKFIPMKEADRILQHARYLYQQNLPGEDQPLPTLVQGLCDLLEELASLPASRMSRAQSESAG